jgi:hypothetical protein
LTNPARAVILSDIETTTQEDEMATAQDIADRIQTMLNAWEAGTQPSPSDRDYVLAATEALGIREDCSDATVEFYADVLYEDAGETFATADDIAAFLFDALTAS